MNFTRENLWILHEKPRFYPVFSLFRAPGLPFCRSFFRSRKGPPVCFRRAPFFQNDGAADFVDDDTSAQCLLSSSARATILLLFFFFSGFTSFPMYRRPYL